MTMNERYPLSVFVMQVSPIPLQRTGFPSGRIFLHISKQIRCFGFFLGETELRQALKSRRRQGGSLQRTVEEAEAADQTSVPEPGLADLGTAWLLCQKGGEHANQAMQTTPRRGSDATKRSRKKTQKERGKERAWPAPKPLRPGPAILTAFPGTVIFPAACGMSWQQRGKNGQLGDVLSASPRLSF